MNREAAFFLSVTWPEAPRAGTAAALVLPANSASPAAVCGFVDLGAGRIPTSVGDAPKLPRAGGPVTELLELPSELENTAPLLSAKAGRLAGLTSHSSLPGSVADATRRPCRLSCQTARLPIRGGLASRYCSTQTGRTVDLCQSPSQSCLAHHSCHSRAARILTRSWQLALGEADGPDLFLLHSAQTRTNWRQTVRVMR